MGFFGKLMLATVVLLAQTSLGRVLCVCPPMVPAPVAAKAAACPMSMQPGCRCCEDGSAKRTKAAKKIQTPGGACQTKAEKSQDAKQLASAPDFPVSAAILPPRPDAAFASVFEPPVQTHLVVPRTRPPDPGLPGLRAPPTR